jgi:hypothetical protein
VIWEDEEWRPVVGLLRYAVSDFGRVYDYKLERLLKQTPDRKGYIRVKLWVGDMRMTVSVHRLVAFAFLDLSNYDDLEVNHIDGDKTYNYIANLELVSRSDNMKHAYENRLIDVPNRTPVLCVETNKEYYSTREAARDLDISCHKSISKVLDKPNKSIRGYHFISLRG